MKKLGIFCHLSVPSIITTYTHNSAGSISSALSCRQQTEREWIHDPLLHTLWRAISSGLFVKAIHLFRFWRDKCLSHKASIIQPRQPKMPIWLEIVHTGSGESCLEVTGNSDRWERENDNISGCKWGFQWNIDYWRFFEWLRLGFGKPESLAWGLATF